MKQPKCYGIYIFGTDISLRYMWRRARIPMQGSGRVVRSDDCDECGARGGQGDPAQGEGRSKSTKNAMLPFRITGIRR